MLFELGFVEVSTISTKTCLITKTNNVAPVIIRNCKEEFQRVCDLKDPIVYGHVTEGGLEHPLLQVGNAAAFDQMLVLLKYADILVTFDLNPR